MSTRSDLAAMARGCAFALGALAVAVAVYELIRWGMQ